MSPINEMDALRAHVYSLLAALLAGPPSKSLLRRLGRIDDQPDSHAEMATAWKMLKAATMRSSPEQLDDEYHRLFIGLGRGELVPYGSWYRSGSVMGRFLAQLRGDLAALGIQRRSDVCETEDHAAALCETMAIICSDPDGIALESQQAFFDDHLAAWMAHFFRDMQQAPSARFYQAVGRLGEVFLALETSYLVPIPK